MHIPTQNYTTEDLGSCIRFSSPCRKSWNRIGLAAGGIAALVIALFSLLRDFVPKVEHSPMGFPIPSLVFLLFGAALLLSELLWQLVGLEIAEVTERQITLKHHILGLDISKNLDAQKIDGLFLSKQSDDGQDDITREFKFLNFKEGAIAINYGKTLWGGVRTYRFGSILDREDAKQVVEQIHERFPHYKYRNRRKAG